MGDIRSNNMFNITKIIKCTLCMFLVVLSKFVSASGSEECLDFHVIHTEPLGYVNQQGEPTGLHWEYLEALQKHSGLCMNISLMPYARIWESIKHGDHDGGIIFRSENRSKLVQYAGHIQTVPTVVIPLKGIKLNTYEDLQYLLIGNMRGVHLSKRFDNDKNLKIVELINFEQETRMIELKRLDAIAGNAFALIYQLEQYDVLDHVSVENQLKLGEKEQWLQFSRKSDKLHTLPILKKSLTELKQKGVFRDILVKYYGVHVTKYE